MKHELPESERSHDACDLSIIVVSWNVCELLLGALASIERSSRVLAPADRKATVRAFGPLKGNATLEVIVVDNASGDGTPQRVAQAFPWVRLIASDENLGFTRGNNLGFAQSRGRFIYFLNPDTEIVNDRIHGDSLWRLFATVQEDSTVGMAGPLLRYADNALQVSVRRFPEPLTGFFESTWLGRAWRRNPWSRRLHMADWQVDYAHDVDWLVGAALLCRREALASIMEEGDRGPFDEGFFMYSEEQDLALRLHLQGWRTVWQPEAVVIHFEGRSSDQAVAARHLHFNTSKVRYWRKWFGVRWSEALRRYLLLEYRGQIVVERTKWLLGHKRAMRAQRIEVYRQVIQSRLKSD